MTARARALRVACMAYMELGAVAAHTAHNFCGEAARVSNNTTVLLDALRGSSITFGFPMWNAITFMDVATFNWKKGYAPTSFNIGDDLTGKLEGYHIELLESLSREAGFRYDIRLTEGASGNESYTEWLSRVGPSYDAILGNWMDTPERRLMGYFVPYELRDSSPLLVTRVHRVHRGLLHELTAFLKPLTASLWLALVCITVVTAGVMWWLEAGVALPAGDQGESEPELSKSSEGFVKSIWLALCTVTGAGAHSPITHGGRLAMWSWSFVVLIVVAAYTANMAMFLIVKSSSAGVLQGFEDARHERSVLCVNVQSAEARALMDFGGGSLEFHDAFGASAADLRRLVLRGTCSGYVASKYDVEKLMAQEEFNHGCQFAVVGHPLRRTSAGWLVRLTGSECHHIMFETLGVLLQNMDRTNYLRQLRHKYLAHLTTVKDKCAFESIASESDPLDVASMAGVYVLHGFLSGIACAGAFRARRRSMRRGERGDSTSSDSDARSLTHR